MSFFSKSPAEKKLEQLTGGYALNDGFKEILRQNGLTIEEGLRIKNQLKYEIEADTVSVEGLTIRINYLIKKEVENKQNNPINENVAFTDNDDTFSEYKTLITQLKNDFDNKKEKVTSLIEKSFKPPQITYDKFMDGVLKASDIFNSQYTSAINIINLASEETPRIDMELENKITTLKSIIKYIDDLTNELAINLSSNKQTADEVENLFEDMEDLIDSVKKYD